MATQASFDYAGATASNPTTGFRNVQPRSRLDREQSKSKEVAEKQRIMERPTRPLNRRDDLGNPIVPLKGSLSYASDAERHAPAVQGLARRTDPAGDEHVKRLQEIAHKQSVVAYKRNVANMREGARWDKIEQEYNFNEQRLAALRNQGGRSNQSGVHYHPFTHEYHPSQQGQLLRYQDDLTRHRAARRAEYLSAQDHRSGYNLLTGAEFVPTVRLPPLPMPPKPAPAAAGVTAFRVDLAFQGHSNSVSNTLGGVGAISNASTAMRGAA